MLILYSEKKVREKLAISPNDFRRIRVDELQLAELDDWMRLRGGAIALTPAGLGQICKHLMGLAPGAGEKIPIPEEFDDCLVDGLDGAAPAEKNVGLEPVEMVILKVYPNRHLLKCRMPAESDAGDSTPVAAVNVWVPDNRKFVARMSLKASQDARGQWRLVGRCPRRKGRY